MVHGGRHALVLLHTTLCHLIFEEPGSCKKVAAIAKEAISHGMFIVAHISANAEHIILRLSSCKAQSSERGESGNVLCAGIMLGYDHPSGAGNITQG